MSIKVERIKIENGYYQRMIVAGKQLSIDPFFYIDMSRER